MIAENLRSVKQNIEKAAKNSGRNPGTIRLIAVTKEVGVSEINEAIDLGVKEIGENRIKDALIKFRAIERSAIWHLIGHLQTNKTRDAVRIFQLIHSVDSVRLASAIDKEAANLKKIQEVLIEVNVSGEKTKFGVRPQDLPSFAKILGRFSNIMVSGLMTIAPMAESPEETRPFYRRLKELAVDLNKKNINGVKMEHLSMGMTQDYGVAVEEGATMVRVGRAIFGG